MFLPPIQRDPEVTMLVNKVHQQMAELLQPFEVQQVIESSVRFVSYEEALKELVSLKNS